LVMLTHLTVRNIATLADVELELPDKGLVVLTGETGAGKSLLVESVMFAIGARMRGNPLREGEARAEVTAQFRLPRKHLAVAALAEQELADPDDPTLLTLRRVLRASGQN